MPNYAWVGSSMILRMKGSINKMDTTKRLFIYIAKSSHEMPIEMEKERNIDQMIYYMSATFLKINMMMMMMMMMSK